MKKRLIALGLIAGVAVMMAGCSTTTPDADVSATPEIVEPSEPVVESNEPSTEPVVESADPNAVVNPDEDVNADVEADGETELEVAE